MSVDDIWKEFMAIQQPLYSNLESIVFHFGPKEADLGHVDIRSSGPVGYQHCSTSFEFEIIRSWIHWMNANLLRKDQIVIQTVTMVQYVFLFFSKQYLGIAYSTSATRWSPLCKCFIYKGYICLISYGLWSIIEILFIQITVKFCDRSIELSSYGEHGINHFFNANGRMAWVLVLEWNIGKQRSWDVK